METPVPFRSKSDLAYEELRRRILTGEYAPGSVIGQARVASEIGLSTTPLREALKRLSAEGLVTLGAHRDARVVPLSAREGRNLYEVRGAVEPLACALAAERRTDADLARIDEAFTALEPLTETASPEALRAHREFHRAIHVAAANPTLSDILDGLWARTDLYRQHALRTGVPDEDAVRARRQHGELRAAIAGRDADRARAVALEHVTISLGRRAIELLEDDAEG